MKNLLILLGIFTLSTQMTAQQCGTIYNTHVSSHFPAADLQIAAFYADAVCQAYNYIDSGMGTPPDYNDSQAIQTLNDLAWTTVMTSNKTNTAFAGKSDLKNLFVNGIYSKGVGRCIAEIDHLALNAPNYDEFLEDLIRIVLEHFFLTLSPQDQAQVSTYIVTLDYIYQFAYAKVQGIKGKDNPLKNHWWGRWGRCVAGTLGGGITGAVAGAMGGAAAGGIGAVPGGIFGGIGGALTGAAASCSGE